MRPVRAGRGNLAVAVVGLLLAAATPALGQTAPTDRLETAADAGPSANGTLADSFSLSSRDDPIHIRSNGLEFLHEEQRIRYLGDVLVTQGDMTIKSDRLTVLYENGAANHAANPIAGAGTSSRQRLRSITAEGGVEITSNGRRATSNTAVFNERKRTVTLRGNVVLQERENQVMGDVVTVFLDEKRSVVKGGRGKRRAQMFLTPE